MVSPDQQKPFAASSRGAHWNSNSAIKYANVFVLNTGRCGSTTFIKACQYITNYSSGHETRWRFTGGERFRFPKNHIEADNRLSWFLGQLDRLYGDDAIYVHLKRDVLATAKSFAERYNRGVMRAFRKLLGHPPDTDPLQVCVDYCETVNANIELFLRNKTRRMTFQCENAQEDFPRFWNLIGAKGNLSAACAEWNIRHNATRPKSLFRRLAIRAGLRV